MQRYPKALVANQKHSVSAGKLNLNPVLEQLEQMEIKLDRFHRLTDRRVTTREMDDIVEKIKESYTIRYPKRLIDSAPVIAQREASQLRSDLNAWLVYNGFNNALYHSENRLLPHEREQIDGRVLNVIEKTLALS